MKILAFDFGASNGRAMLGDFDGKIIKLSELHRFPNQPRQYDGGLFWDFDQLFAEIKTALAKCDGIPLSCIGIDTWGVDFGLIDSNGELLRPPRHYRDEYTKGMIDVAGKRAGGDEIYQKTGIQTLWFNTLYQLLALSLKESELLSQADKILFMPDLFNYMLTGQMHSEYTVASTSQLLNAGTGDWEYGLVEELKLPARLFVPVAKTGTLAGTLKPEYGLGEIPVALVGSHDTASAVVSVPYEEGVSAAYISSGTWSLMGVELDRPLINEETRAANLTNAGGVGGTIRFLKNIMVLWIVQQCRQQWIAEGEDVTFAELTELAEHATPHLAFIDPDDDLFAPPGDMPARIVEYCEKTGQEVPNSKGETVRCVLESLAFRYRETLESIEKLTGRKIEAIHIIGGGTQNELLCQMAADATGKRVLAGPVEATALGNMVVQLMALGEIETLSQGRQVVKDSFAIREYRPSGDLEQAYQRFLEVTGGNQK